MSLLCLLCSNQFDISILFLPKSLFQAYVDFIILWTLSIMDPILLKLLIISEHMVLISLIKGWSLLAKFITRSFYCSLSIFMISINTTSICSKLYNPRNSYGFSQVLHTRNKYFSLSLIIDSKSSLKQQLSRFFFLVPPKPCVSQEFINSVQNFSSAEDLAFQLAGSSVSLILVFIRKSYFSYSKLNSYYGAYFSRLISSYFQLSRICSSFIFFFKYTFYYYSVLCSPFLRYLQVLAYWRHFTCLLCFQFSSDYQFESYSQLTIWFVKFSRQFYSLSDWISIGSIYSFPTEYCYCLLVF